ncbi:YfgM family protein [Aidingimonas halophila]|uniref:Ancillary SecYEG translocon subunit n=1 Tax=Aidingimonas halophila TaxID=574349 RepID=A0A1H2ZP36_9GAMM|nr:tetratricopeptide repeat protein [Aidingimonas halophila]GHC16328.1 membrane protein [Aidingimonas halophila]SDX18594.1 Putative negative regulator of RcsB-dependent stress response [Aidingimonas halophila]
MAELRTEEEQLEAIKRWFKQNGLSLAAGVVIAIAGVLGWNAWQDYQAGQAEAASMRYQQLLDLAGRDALDEANLTRALGLVDEINEEHGDTLYADLALLLEAKLSVRHDDLAGARIALADVVDTSDQDYIRDLARLRLARLLIAEDEPDSALAQLEGDIADSLSPQRADIRGDAYMALDQVDDARESWREALELSDTHDQPLYGVQLKLDNLGAEDSGL